MSAAPFRPDAAEAERLLARTPAVLDAWLRDLPDAWTRADEGPGTWSAHEIVAHLVYGEETDWLPRVRHLLEHGPARPFAPFDRAGHATLAREHGTPALLDRFAAARAASLRDLRGLGAALDELARPGLHPELGPVTLGELLATWVAHDLGHVRQVARVLAGRLRDAVGPWRAYLPVLGEGPTGRSGPLR